MYRKYWGCCSVKKVENIQNNYFFDTFLSEKNIFVSIKFYHEKFNNKSQKKILIHRYLNNDKSILNHLVKL